MDGHYYNRGTIKRTNTENEIHKPKKSKIKNETVTNADDNVTSNDVAPMNVDNVETYSNDSNETVTYNVDIISPSNKTPRCFSPIPSTSRDNETFLKNDLKLNQSLLLHNDSSSELVDVPCETSIFDDEMDKPCLPMIYDVDEENPINLELNHTNIENNSLKNDNSIDNDSCIIVGEVLCRNRALLNKYNKDSPDIENSNKDNQNNIMIEDNNKVKVAHHRKKKNTKDPVNKPSRDNSQNLENVVNNFFSANINSMEPLSTTSSNTGNNPLLTSSPKTGENTVLKYIANNFLHYAQTALQLITGPTEHRQEISEVIDLDSSEIEFVPTQPPINSHERSTQNDDSVIFVSITHNDNSSTLKVRQRKSKIKPSTPVNDVVSTPEQQQNQINATSPRLGDCPICMDNLSVGPIASTLCGHIFCMKCITKAVNAMGKKCPTCRKTLKGKNYYHQLFL